VNTLISYLCYFATVNHPGKNMLTRTTHQYMKTNINHNKMKIFSLNANNKSSIKMSLSGMCPKSESIQNQNLT
jgi:hypothetical protein